jgi:hypothetical protein
MTARSNPSDLESLLQLLNDLASPSDTNAVAHSAEQPTETADTYAKPEGSRAASIEGAVDAENRFAIHVVRGMMKAKGP